MAEATRLCPVCRTIMKSAAYKVGKQDGVERLENNILEKYFNTEVDFAWMSTLNQMVVENYNIDLANNEEIISGNLKVQAQIDGFVLEEKEGGFIYKDSVMLPLTLLYEFHVKNQEYRDLYLEYLG